MPGCSLGTRTVVRRGEGVELVLSRELAPPDLEGRALRRLPAVAAAVLADEDEERAGNTRKSAMKADDRHQEELVRASGFARQLAVKTNRRPDVASSLEACGLRGVACGVRTGGTRRAGRRGRARRSAGGRPSPGRWRQRRRRLSVSHTQECWSVKASRCA